MNKTLDQKKILFLATMITLAMYLVSSCTTIIPSNSSINQTPTTRPTCPALQAGLTYLKQQYNPEIGLIREAPNAAPNIYWLTNDNALAAFVLTELNEIEFGRNLSISMKQFGKVSNGLIEIIWGQEVDFPPSVANPILLKQIDGSEIWQEVHREGPIFEDWAEYANLSFLGTLNLENQGNHNQALDIFNKTIDLFDGTGFKDKAYNGSYETYKLALALYTGSILHTPIPKSAKMLEILLLAQNENGGFFTHYNKSLLPAGDTNTETTAFALLALNQFGCGN